MQSKTTILFFARYLGHTGSEILLRKLVNELANDKNLKIVVAGYTDGPIVGEFTDAIEYISFDAYRARRYRFINRQIDRFDKKKSKSFEYDFYALLHKKYPDALWVLNTLGMHSPLGFAKDHHIPLVMWVHEMDFFYYWLDSKAVELIRTVPQKYICVSEAVKRTLQNIKPNGSLFIVYPGMYSSAELNHFEEKFRKNEDNNKASLTIAMAGTLDANKNPLYFLDLARFLKNKNERRFKLMWIGGREDDGMYVYLNKAIESNDLKGWVEFIPHQKDKYLERLGEADLFLHTSYKDSFPLVMLDAAALGIPVLGWNSGGIVEFINNDKIGTVLSERNFEFVLHVITDIAEGRKAFDKEKIRQRSREFEFHDFVRNFKDVLNGF
jgi:glycosyltransferase involved in cell wall biosynthesis